MKKNLSVFYIVYSLTLVLVSPLILPSEAQESSPPEFSEGEYKLNPKTSSAIPSFIGEVLHIQGRAVKSLVEDRKQDILLIEGQKLYAHDIIKTSKKSGLKIQMVDDTIIYLAESSALEFDKYEYKSKNDRQATYQFDYGQMLAIFKIKAKSENDIKINLGDSTIKLQGTTVAANLFTIKTEQGDKEIREVAVPVGEIEIINRGSNRKHFLHTGDHYLGIIGAKGNKEKIVRLPAEQLKNLQGVSSSGINSFSNSQTQNQNNNQNNKGDENLNKIWEGVTFLDRYDIAAENKNNDTKDKEESITLRGPLGVLGTEDTNINTNSSSNSTNGRSSISNRPGTGAKKETTPDSNLEPNSFPSTEHNSKSYNWKKTLMDLNKILKNNQTKRDL